MLVSMIYYALILFIPYQIYRETEINIGLCSLLLTGTVGIIIYFLTDKVVSDHVAYRKTVIDYLRNKDKNKKLKPHDEVFKSKYNYIIGEIFNIDSSVVFTHYAAVSISGIFFTLCLLNNILTMSECLKYTVFILGVLDLIHFLIAALCCDFEFFEAILVTVIRMSRLTASALAGTGLIILGIIVCKVLLPIIFIGGIISMFFSVGGILLLIFFISRFSD